MGAIHWMSSQMGDGMLVKSGMGLEEGQQYMINDFLFQLKDSICLDLGKKHT